VTLGDGFDDASSSTVTPSRSANRAVGILMRPPSRILGSSPFRTHEYAVAGVTWRMQAAS